MKRLLIFLMAFIPSLSYGQWAESFESSKDTALYACWNFHEATIVDYAGGYEGWMHLVKLNTTGYVETPYMEFDAADGFQSVYFTFYTTGNEGKTAALSIDYIDEQGDPVAGYFLYGEGNGSFGATTRPQEYSGKVKARISVYAVNDSGQTVNVYLDEFQGFNLGLICQEATLPVNLISFKAIGDRLVWATAMESNSERFAIEHSTDGTTFREIGSVQAAGFSQGRKDYSFHFAKVGGTSYFRLRTIDKDGTFELSNIVAVVSREDIAFGPFIIGVSEKVLSLSVFDMQGTQLKEYQAPETFPALVTEKPLIVRLQTDSKVYSKKVMYR